MINELVAAGSQFLQAPINWLTQRGAIKQQTKANLELAKYGYSKDLEMWNRMNEYNDPSQQMARLKAAGLNPNLVYGSGGATTQAAQMPKFNAPTAALNTQPLVDLPSTIAMFQDMQIKNQQLSNMKTQQRVMEQNEEGKTIANWIAEQTKGWKASEGQLKFNALQLANQLKAIQGRQARSLEDYNVEIAANKARSSSLLYEKGLADISKTQVSTEMQSEIIDWMAYMNIMKLVGGASTVVKGLGGMFKKNMNVKQLEEFKRKFIRSYEGPQFRR